MKTTSTRPANAGATEAIVLDSDTADSDNDAVIVETGETTPETHDDAEYKEPIAVDEEADRQAEQARGKDQAVPSVSPPHFLARLASRLTGNWRTQSRPKDEKEAKKLLRKALLDVVEKVGSTSLSSPQQMRTRILTVLLFSRSSADTALHGGYRKGEGAAPTMQSVERLTPVSVRRT
jgi:hypothetical protein